MADREMVGARKIVESATAKSMRLIARAIAAGRLQTISSGTEYIPTAGSALIIARHYHHLFDGLALFAAVPRPFHILVALDWAESASMSKFMRGMTRLARWPTILRTDAFRRHSETDSSHHGSRWSLTDAARFRREALHESIQLLAEHRLLVVFPEGYPNIDPTYTPKVSREDFLPFKAGFVAIARSAERRLGATLPIIPTGLRYTAGKPWLAKVSFGRPVSQRDFSCGDELVRYCEKTIKQLSS